MRLTRRGLLGLSVARLLTAKDDAGWITALGGKVERDAAGNVVAANLAQTWINDAETIELAGLRKLERLNLAHTRISDEGLLHLRPARQIRELSLMFTEQITDQGMTAIKEWRALVKLNVRGTRVADGTLGIVSGLTQLESLDLTNTLVTENGLEGLIPLTKIRHLALGQSRVPESAMEMLRFLNTLESLDLSGPRGAQRRTEKAKSTSLAEPLVRAMAELHGLRTLKLGHTTVGAEDLRKLGPKLGKVEKLGLEGCPQVNDDAARALGEWAGLRYLDLQDTAVSAGAVDALKKARPGLKVLTGGDAQKES